jgi:hypothetical protein
MYFGFTFDRHVLAMWHLPVTCVLLEAFRELQTNFKVL